MIILRSHDQRTPDYSRECKDRQLWVEIEVTHQYQPKINIEQSQLTENKIYQFSQTNKNGQSQITKLT
jgi:hypothetical protein